MPVTFRAFLDERRKRNDGTYPVKIRITKDGVSREINLNVVKTSLQLLIRWL